MPSPRSNRALEVALSEHLNWWGLRRFETDAAYFRWQRDQLTTDELAELHRLVEMKRTAPAEAGAEVAFYDRTADARILRVLYSQRYDYYLAVGPLIAERISRAANQAAAVLDVGCGIGLLTTFYARQFPHLRFVGVDRSFASLGEARKRAEALGLDNVRFECLDITETSLRGTYDLIISTQTLLQAEQDPGLPSATWQGFERARDPAMQALFEDRTGLRRRLTPLCEALAPAGRLIVFEKARLLSRRIPFQRAFADRGFRLLELPVPVRYRIVEEISDDGPLYVMTRAPAGPNEPGAGVDWDEQPEPSEDSTWFRCTGRAAEFVQDRLPDRTVLDAQQTDSPFGRVTIERGRAGALLAYYCWNFQDRNKRFVLVEPLWAKGQAAAGPPQLLPEQLAWPEGDEEEPDHVPLYEIHSISAQDLWSSLPDRRVEMEKTWNQADGSQMHVELGTAGGFVYLYQTNSHDQRQLVIMEPQRRAWLEQYYQEIVQSAE